MQVTMEIVQDMQDNEPSKLVSLSKGSYSEGRLGKLPMEGDNASYSASPKYNNPSISDIRRFCGRFAVSITRPSNKDDCLATNENTVDGDVEIISSHSATPEYNSLRVSAPGESSTGCGHFATAITRPSDKAGCLATTENTVDGDIDCERPCGTTFHVATPKYKLRRVSAIRDFPPGCQFATAITNPVKQTNCFATTENTVDGDTKSGHTSHSTFPMSKHPRISTWDSPSGCGKHAAAINRPSNYAVSHPNIENTVDDDVEIIDCERFCRTGMDSQSSKVLQSTFPSTFPMSDHPGVPNRDLPSECGQFAAAMTTLSNEAGYHPTIENTVDNDVEIIGYERFYGSGVDSQSSNVLQGTVPSETPRQPIHLTSQIEKAALLSNQVDALELINGKPAKNLASKLEPVKDFKSRTPGILNDMILLKQTISAQETVNNEAEQPEETCVNKKSFGGGEVTQPISILEGTSSQMYPSLISNASRDMGQLVVWSKNDSLQHDGDYEKCHVSQSSHNYHVTPPPLLNNSGGEGRDICGTVSRKEVRETLRLFHTVYRKLLQEHESKSKEQEISSKPVHYLAASVLKDRGKYMNVGKQIIGPVSGIEVGDEFTFMVELNIVGLHRQSQAGIDYVKQDGRILATSIVASGGYDDDMDDSDVLIYTGQGGNLLKKNKDKEPEDQKLERGNLALMNSISARNPVRVIRGGVRSSSSSNAKIKTYVYDGLYLVENYKKKPGPHKKLVFKFKLVRIPDQPKLARKVINNFKKSKVREGLCVNDISQGKELISICAINILNDEKPPPFEYITGMMYPDWCRPIPAEGCDCIDGCSDSRKCLCVMRNGGEIPYNHNGAVIEVKPFVYECGPNCKCPPSCHNRVSQHGVKFTLEIFKTDSRGWGVRSLNFIPSGSFICEYAGELLDDKEAEQRTGNDEYLFDIGNKHDDTSLCCGLSTDSFEEGGFTIDAAQYGNVGRFINHSCSPNLYAQDVLYDHEDTRIPHIMFFAAENISPLRELTYDYNYTLDQVYDADGNIKRKDCHCGSADCTGRLY